MLAMSSVAPGLATSTTLRHFYVSAPGLIWVEPKLAEKKGAQPIQYLLR